MRDPEQIPDISADMCSYNLISGRHTEQSVLGMDLLDGWLGETGEVTPAVAQLRGMADMVHPVVDQGILAGGGADD
ncbi:hypothetical protein RJ53_07095 [Methanocalculus chunghsingensis]|uniref:Uncharacterized protein n=1 Tax=Methanocalculus chunghsingensis TaxID=156457 RepID=A0A8J7W6L0_9EURY|nr:hypothetical protein [Methanocalculus chunghsingensis]MBR1369271.1 hypothetical protein [Methanocalculus chunghsingensis]